MAATGSLPWLGTQGNPKRSIFLLQKKCIFGQVHQVDFILLPQLSLSLEL